MNLTLHNTGVNMTSHNNGCEQSTSTLSLTDLCFFEQNFIVDGDADGDNRVSKAEFIRYLEQFN